MFKNIPQHRLLIYALIIGLLPIFPVVVGLWNRDTQLEGVNWLIDEVDYQARTYKKRQAVNIAVRNHYHEADHFYLDKHLETLVFLEPEMDALQRIVNNRNFAGDPIIKKRLDFLLNENNMVFTEGVVQSYPHYQETVETLVHPVEVNIEDIKKILTKTEGVEMGSYKPGPNRPQLIVLEYKIDKKNHPDNNEVFVLSMKLLKREYL